MSDHKNLMSKGMVIVGLSFALGVVQGGLCVAAAQADSQLDAQIHKALDKKQFQGVSASLKGDDVILTGTVSLYADKEDADSRVHHIRGVKGVDNEIQIAGPTMEDAALRDKLAQALAVDRVGYGTTAFNAINLGVHDGVATLSGTVYGPPDRDSALSLVAHTPGVKDVVDDLEVAPVSPMDDRLRIELARSIYGTSQLSKYAVNPQKPIRITVVNGNVTLSGVVDNQADRDVAGIRANGVPGVFKVVNNIQVAQASSGK